MRSLIITSYLPSSFPSPRTPSYTLTATHLNSRPLPINPHHSTSQQVNVGWGSKATQFHGSEGKAAATAPKQNTKCTDTDSGEPHATEYESRVAVSIATETGRKIVVYNEEMEIYETSEDIHLLEEMIDWRPTGELIAGTQVIENGKRQVVFFEPNALRHGEFSIRSIGDIRLLQWNADGKFLAVHVNTTNGGLVEVYSRSNYHWALTQTIVDVAEFQWHEAKALTAYYTNPNGVSHELSFLWEPLRSYSGMVAQIDGCKLGLTNFAQCNIPPPMAQYWIGTEQPIRHVSFWNKYVCVLTEKYVLIYDENQQVLHRHRQSSPNIFQRQANITSSSQVLVLCYDDAAECDILQHIDLADGSIQQQKIPSSSLLHFSEQVATAVLITNEGDALLVRNEDLEPIANINHVVSVVLASIENELTLFTLNKRNQLYANENLISAAATSFICHDNFLIYTTVENTARFIEFSDDILTNYSAPHAPNPPTGPYDEALRKIENGAKIVACTPQSTSLVLQMPRGNLETITPLAMVLSTIRNSLVDKAYLRAFKLCRRHRIDLNYLLDWSQQEIMQPDNFENFIRQIGRSDKGVEYLNLLLTALKNEDVTITMYTGMSDTIIESKRRTIKDYGSTPQKSTQVCKAVRTIIEPWGKDFTQPILTTFVRQDPPALKEALETVQGFTAKIDREESLKYLTFLVDVNQLFDHALGLYDFELALMVAGKSQKDPREYLPFLSHLQSLDTYRCRFEIDDHLKRYQSAFHHLAKTGDMPQILSYMMKHKLFSTACSVFAGHSAYKDVLLTYGAYLYESYDFNEAGFVFYRAGEMEQAFESFMKCDPPAWRDAFKIKIDEEMVEDTVQELDSKRIFDDAAIICRDYLKDDTRSTQYWCRAGQWAEAIRVCPLDKEDVVRDCLIQCAAAIADHLDEIMFKYNKQIARLRIVKDEKMARLDQGPSIEIQNDLLPDTASQMSKVSGLTGVTTLASTRFTTSTSARSARSKRKHLSKKNIGKEGTVHEEGALKTKLLGRIAEFTTLQKEIAAIIPYLFRFGLESTASRLKLSTTEVRSNLNEGANLLSEAVLPEFIDLSAQLKQIIMSLSEGTSIALVTKEWFANLPDVNAQRAPQVEPLSGWKLVG